MSAKLKKVPDTPPGSEHKMEPKPQSYKREVAEKLKGKVSIITGGDSGIGKAVALLFAREGAQVVIAYLSEHEDAYRTKEEIEGLGSSCLLISGNIAQEQFSKEVIDKTLATFGHVDIVVNNAAMQRPQESLLDISAQQLEDTFRTNIFGYFYLSKAALPHLKEGACIINTTSVTAYRGSPHLLDYSSTKGAIVSFTRSLALNLASQKIRVNAVAPGPVWTPLVHTTFEADEIESFGQDVPLGRPGQPSEIAPAFLFLASDDGAYITGQVIHPNGGEIING